MAIVDRLRELVGDLLPSGPFWRTAAAERFRDALASALVTTGTLVTELRQAIFPGTADRPVLSQWWEYIKAECAPTPADTEELRAAVLAVLSSPPGHTFAGLELLVAGPLPFVELTQHLPISSVPMDVPGDINPHGRVLEVWYSPVLNSRTTVECIVRPFAQAADELRIVSPASSIEAISTLLEDHAIHWQHGRDGELVIEVLDGVTVVEDTVWPLPQDTGAERLTEFLTESPLDGLTLRWHLQRDFGDGPVAITAVQTFQYVPAAIVYPSSGAELAQFLSEFGDLVVEPTSFWRFDQGDGETAQDLAADNDLTPSSSPIQGTVDALLGGAVLELEEGEGRTMSAGGTSVLNVTTGGVTLLVIHRLQEPPSTQRMLMGKRVAGGTAGFELRATATEYEWVASDGVTTNTRQVASGFEEVHGVLGIHHPSSIASVRLYVWELGAVTASTAGAVPSGSLSNTATFAVGPHRGSSARDNVALVAVWLGEPEIIHTHLDRLMRRIGFPSTP